MKSGFRYQANICGGDFQHVRDCFVEWKRQPLVYRQSQPVFEGKEEVRPLSDSAFGNGEVAHTVLTQVCDPRDPYALAAEIRDGEHDMWLVMAAYDK
ncbi:hypothetical protein [Paraburkholderia elongata]|uniref:Uncharacterized protein n=1 Tax=Paraburkholderia elongata TaxID=2675747 RepID=A0A972SN12_9BURK|nr:hypothetical protein [Paraburkholderia elongata]NPT60824.1 hypothetical protein [Paraburkholderia elongata]